MNIVTFFVKRSYASLAAGNFAIGSKHVQELIESECFIVYADTGLGNTFALKNIMLTQIDEHNVRVTFDPLTDVHALPNSILPKDVTNSVETYGMFVDEMKDVPRFNVSNDASGNNPNLLSLNLDCRQRFVQYHGGLCTLTDLVLTLHETGVHVVQIDNSVRQTRNDVAVLAQYPRTVFELNKDNGVKDKDWPVLARMFVLM